MKAGIKVLITILFTLILTVTLVYAQGSDNQTKSVNVKKGDKLMVKTSYGDLDIKIWNENTVKVNFTNRGDGNTNDIELTKNGNTISLVNRSDGEIEIDEILIPSYLDLDLKTGGGSIDIGGNLSGNLEAKSAGGDIEFKNVDGTVDVKTGGGSINSANIKGKSDIKTAGGDVELGQLNGGSVKTSGGSISIANSSKSLDVKSGGGNISVGNISGDIDAGTGGGNIKLGKVSGSADIKTGGGNIEIGSAKGKVSSKTGGGNISLSGVSGSVEAVTGAGDIEAKLWSVGKEDSRLATGQGNITLYISSNSKVTINVSVKNMTAWDTKDSDYIESDFPSTLFNKTSSGVNAVYKLNGGGTNIDITASNGKIEIKKLAK